MSKIILPALWLIVIIAGLPQLSETVYTPSLPEIAHTLNTTESMVEHTLAAYLFGFAIGILFWGKISDRVGRKPCIIAGLIIFIIGCLGCYHILMINRLIQAFGGSIGSVLSQAVSRDSFHGPALNKIYSTIGSALALFPALGPLCGGLIAELMGWRNIFIVLILFAVFIIICVILKLPETYPKTIRKKISIFIVIKQLFTDRKVLCYMLFVGTCNGIMFSYFAEGSFCLIKRLSLSPSHYGLSFILIATSSMIGGLYSKKLQNTYSGHLIINLGIRIINVATVISSIIAVIDHFYYSFPEYIMIGTIILSQMCCAFGICLTTANTLALALVDYKHAIGTASSVFGFAYYCISSLLTFFIGILHNGTLLIMPLYFLVLSCLMISINYFCYKKFN